MIHIIYNIKGSVEQIIYHISHIHHIRSFVIVCVSVLVYIKQRSRVRRQRVKQHEKRRKQQMNERRARGAKYPHSIDLTLPSCSEDTSDIQMIHCLSSDSNIVTDELYLDFFDGSAVWLPKNNTHSASHSDSTNSSSITILSSYIPSSQYSASKTVPSKGKKKSKKSRKHQQQQPPPRQGSAPASFCTPPPLPPPTTKAQSPSKARSPRLTKAGNYMICLTAPNIIILFILYHFSTYIVYN